VATACRTGRSMGRQAAMTPTPTSIICQKTRSLTTPGEGLSCGIVEDVWRSHRCSLDSGTELRSVSIWGFLLCKGWGMNSRAGDRNWMQ